MSLLAEIEVLAQALASPLGIRVAVSDFDLARQRLYKARKDSPDFACLRLRQGPKANEIWITKDKIQAEEHQ